MKSFCSLGCKILQEEQPQRVRDRDSCESGIKLAADAYFRKSVETYLESFCEDTTQLAHGRTAVIKAARNVISSDGVDKLWCGFSQVSEHHFEALTKQQQWPTTEKLQLLEGWLQLTLPAFVAGGKDRRIAINNMTAWIKRYKELTGTDTT